MSTRQLLDGALALPLEDRLALAQQLWDSIDSEATLSDDPVTLQTAMQRERELSEQLIAGRTHEQVMQAVRNTARD